MNIEQIIKELDEDRKYHLNQMDICVNDSKDWCEHLGAAQALTSIRFKLKKLAEQQ